MLPQPGERDGFIQHATEEVWTSIDHMTNALQDCIQAGEYPAAARIAAIVEGLWNLVKPAPKIEPPAEQIG